jgi:hypothetical protein
MTLKEFHSVIAVRTYAVGPAKTPFEKRTPDIGYSNWTLTFDTETITDEFQNLRFGVFQLRKRKKIRRVGIFFDPQTISVAELEALEAFCEARGLELLNLSDFLEQFFFRYVYKLNALCIGFNLPFDLSRLAIECAPARRSMRGGFSFKLSLNKARLRLQIKRLDSGAAFIRFAQIYQNSTQAMRENDLWVPSPPGYFVSILKNIRLITRNTEP